MPHDIVGTELKVGDCVNIPCRVKEIHITEEYCNLSLETFYPMYPTDNPSRISLNAKQVRRGGS